MTGWAGARLSRGGGSWHLRLCPSLGTSAAAPRLGPSRGGHRKKAPNDRSLRSQGCEWGTEPAREGPPLPKGPAWRTLGTLARSGGASPRHLGPSRRRLVGRTSLPESMGMGDCGEPRAPYRCSRWGGRYHCLASGGSVGGGGGGGPAAISPTPSHPPDPPPPVSPSPRSC